MSKKYHKNMSKKYGKNKKYFGGNNQPKNAEIIKILKLVALYYKLKKDKYRALAYENAVNSIISYNKTIKNYNDAIKIPNIGKSIASKIVLILERRENEFLPSDFKIVKTYNELINTKEIGAVKAKELINEYGVKDLEDLKKKVKRGDIELTHAQKISLKYHKDLSTPIPFDIIAKIGKLFDEIAKEIDKKLVLRITGSHRRGRDFSNDIDILLFHPAIKTAEDFIENKRYAELFVNKLKKKGIIVATMKETFEAMRKKTPKVLNGEYIIKTKFSPRYFKIDLKMYPCENFATALMYFTGSKNFNIKMRKLIKKEGYSKLNEYGLYKISKSGKEQKVETKTENDIFEKLGLKYISPKDRDI